MLCEIEWQIKPQLEEWAEVAVFDVPGVGDEPPAERLGPEAAIERGISEISDRGWDRCVIVGDEFGIYYAVQIAAERRSVVEGLALGHACLSLRETGDRAPVNHEVWSAMARLRDVDYRSYARHMTQVTQGAYDDQLAERYIERVPQDVIGTYTNALAEQSGESLEPLIGSLDMPLLFAKHEGCLGFTDEGWEDAVAAFPDATTVELAEKPSTSPDFAEALRSFCTALEN